MCCKTQLSVLVPKLNALEEEFHATTVLTTRFNARMVLKHRPGQEEIMPIYRYRKVGQHAKLQSEPTQSMFNVHGEEYGCDHTNNNSPDSKLSETSIRFGKVIAELCDEGPEKESRERLIALGKFVGAIRRAKRLSVAHVAQKCHITPGELTHVELGLAEFDEVQPLLRRLAILFDVRREALEKVLKSGFSQE